MFYSIHCFSTHGINPDLYPIVYPFMETNRETQLLKHSIIVYNLIVYTV